jgi:hypothetical protein
MKNVKTLLGVAAMVAAASGFGAIALEGNAGAVTASATPVTVEGHLAKFTTMSDFILRTMHETIVVDTTAMTHVTENGMALKVHSLKPGWLLTVKGPEENKTVHATRIIVDTM